MNAPIGIGGRRVLFGAGSSVIVEFEETCRRLGVEIAAIIANTTGPSETSLPEKIIPLWEADSAIFCNPISIPIFTPAFRQMALREARERGGLDFSPLIDPTAILPTRFDCGDGVFVNAGVTVGSFSRLDEFSFVNRSVSLGHHNVVGAFASIGPGVTTGGFVSIGPGAVLGIGATVLPEVTVGANAVVSAGSVVAKDVPSGCLVAGNPARILAKGKSGYRGMEICVS